MRSLMLLAPLLAAGVTPGCDSVPLLAPTGSTVRVVVADASIANGDSTVVKAAVTELAGTPVHDGTVVTFSTTLGAIDPAESQTSRGQASATLTAGTQSGIAEVAAYSGGAVSEAVEVAVGAAAVASVHLSAQPASLPPGGGAAVLLATVLDAAQNRLPNVTVAFAASAGALRDRVVTTDGSGEARTVLRTTTAAEVTASAGGADATAAIEVDAATAISISATPARPTAGQAVSFEVALVNESRAVAGASIAFGDGASHRLGVTAGATVMHTYEAAGAYTVTVIATDVAGHVAESSILVQVRPVPELAVTVEASPAAPVVDEAVTLTVEVSRPEDAPAVREVTLEFGDSSRVSLGPLSGRRSVVHVYEAAGSYAATVTARDASGRRYASSAAVQVRPAPGMSVTVEATPAAPAAGEAVTFAVEVSGPEGGPAVREVTLEFGDSSRVSLGALSGRRSVVHVYDEPGSYEATVTALDASGGRYASSAAVQVRPAPGLSVTVEASPASPVVGEAVTFAVEVSRPEGGPVVREVTLEFGDSSRVSLGALSGRRSVVHVYEAAGSYAASATARDAANRLHHASIGLRIRPAPGMSVTVAASPAAPVAGQPVTFTVEVSPAAGAPAVREVTLDFGDGSAASLGALDGRGSVAHVYERPGSYIVAATVLDAGGRRRRSSIGVVVAGG